MVPGGIVGRHIYRVIHQGGYAGLYTRLYTREAMLGMYYPTTLGIPLPCWVCTPHHPGYTSVLGWERDNEARPIPVLWEK